MMNSVLLRRRFSLGATAALLGAALLLGACGGDNEGNEGGQPAVETPAAAATAAGGGAEATATLDANATPEAGVGASGEITAGNEVSNTTENITDATVITETGVVTQEVVTQTTVLTNSEVVTQVEVLTQPVGTSENSQMTGTQGTGGTGTMTGTQGTGANGATETGGMTGTQEMTGTGATTGTQGSTQQGQTQAAAAAASAGTLAGINGAQNASVRASTLMGYNFENSDGNVSGEIKDLLLDLQSGRVLFTKIAYGGVLGLGDKDIVIPLNGYKIGDKGQLVLNFDENALQNFPDLHGSFPNLDDPNWANEVNTFWTQQGMPAPASMTQSANTKTVAWASDLIGKQTNDLGNGAGEIQDMIVNLGAGTAQYVLVDFGNDNGQGPYIMPWTAFNIENRGDQLTFAENVKSDIFQNAPRLNNDQFPTDATWDSNQENGFATWWREHGFRIGS